MRTPIIAGNWKMHKTVAEAMQLARGIREEVSGIDKVETVLCPPFTALVTVKDTLANTKIGLGAQNMFWEEEGAYTGEISPLMLAGLCDYVILGHSERREYFGETDEGVNKKAKVVLAHGMKPIICVGENLDQNEAGQTEAWVSKQVRGAFEGIPAADAAKIVVAYEPIWAIGTGRTAEPADANTTISMIRRTLAETYDDDTAQTIRIQYGGSVKPANIEAIMREPEIDGALVGGASLKIETFVPLVKGALVKFEG